MTHVRTTPIRVLWLVWACLLLLPRLSAAADPLLAADFDGDGLRDHVILNHHEPSVLRLWLSASRTTQLIRASAPVQHVVAADLDGDHRPELIARDVASRLHVWTHRHKAFKAYRPRASIPFTITGSRRHAVDDTHSDAADAADDEPVAAIALPACPPSRAPAPATTHGPRPYVAPPVRSLSAVDPFLPRPPPTALPL